MLPFILAAVGGYLIWDSQKRKSFSQGGTVDLELFRKKYDNNEEKNFHRENLILLAKTFGDENDVKEAKKIKSKVDSIGYMPPDLNDVSYALHKKLWSKYLEMNQSKKKFDDGGELKYIGSVAIVETPEDFKKWAEKRTNKMELINEYEGFKVGDTVTFTNEAGIEFPNMKIIGIEKDTSFYGRNIYLNSDAYWYPHSTKELKKQK